MEAASSSFYVTLPSNACKDIYPYNTAGSYKVKLAHPILLKYNYEVGLAEIQFTKSWYTLNSKCSELWLDQGSGYRKYCLDQGFYNDIQTVIDNMFVHIKLTDISMEYHKISKCVKVYLRNGMKLKLSQGLADILGLPAMVDITQTTIGEHAADVRRGMTALYLYSNIGEPQFVGDALVPLLKIVDYGGSKSDVMTKRYNMPHYIPVRKRELDKIEINICDDTGEIVSFTSGKVICKLHFRLRQP